MNDKVFCIEDYDNVAEQYAKDIVSGKELANKWIRAEAKRFLDRLEKSKNGTFEYEFDYNLVRKINRFLLVTNFATGFYANKPVLPNAAPFQLFILHNIYCWRNVETGERLIREVLLQIARKNSKTWTTGIIMIIGMVVEEDFSQMYSAAKTRQLATLIMKEIADTLQVSPVLKNHFTSNNSYIRFESNKNTFKTASSEANNSNGTRPGIFVIDEAANMVTDELFQALRLGQLSVVNPLAINISTAYDLEICYFKEKADYIKKVLDGITEDERIFSMIFELDKDDDYTDVQVWPKATPLQCSFESGLTFLKDEFKKALELGGATLQEFRIKMLNQYITGNSAEVYIPIDELKKCEINEFSWRGRDVYIGIDLSLSGDNTSICLLTYDKDIGYVAQSYCFIPSEGIETKSTVEKVPYNTFIRQGICFAEGDGKIISYKFIEDMILGFEEKLGCTIKSICYDKYNAMSTVQKLEDNGIECVEVKQTSSTLHHATKTLKECVLENRFKYVGPNQLLLINFSNAKLMHDSNMNCYVNKKLSYKSGKIDMVAALINAIAVCETDILNGSVFESEDYTIRFL